MRLRVTVIVLSVCLLAPAGIVFAGGETEVEAEDSLEVMHWWTSGGEAAALSILKDMVEDMGIEWIDSPIAGGGGTEAMTALRSRATAGDPPAAVQMLGFDILDWAELGFVAEINDIAREGNWDNVVPGAIQRFSVYEGDWIAAPVNVHSTNWVWANTETMDELGLDIPTTWDEFIAAMETAEEAGYIGLAHGGQAWQEATIFDGVVISAGGPEFYERAMIDLDPDALGSDTMREVFERMEQLRGFVDDDFSGRDWNLASAMVIEGEALFQIMGDWAKGEFIAADMEPGVDFQGFRVPGSQGTVTFNSDQFVFFEVEPRYRDAQEAMARLVMDPEFQIGFNQLKGSVPARTDISGAELDSIGQMALQQLAEADESGTLFGSMGHGHAVPAAVQEAMYDVITAHFNRQISSEDAVSELVDAVARAQ